MTAAQEAEGLGHGYIGPEHLLLALLDEGEGLSMQVLQNMRVNVGKLRSELFIEMAEEEEDIRTGGNPFEDDEENESEVTIEDLTTNLTEKKKINFFIYFFS